MPNKVCAREDCAQDFEPTKHNQVYCSPECRQIATNARVMARYYEDRDRRNGKKRKCKISGCESQLSRYNESNICAKCQARENDLMRLDILEFIGYEID